MGNCTSVHYSCGKHGKGFDTDREKLQIHGGDKRGWMNGVTGAGTELWDPARVPGHPKWAPTPPGRDSPSQNPRWNRCSRATARLCLLGLPTNLAQRRRFQPQNSIHRPELRLSGTRGNGRMCQEPWNATSPRSPGIAGTRQCPVPARIPLMKEEPSSGRSQ